MAISRKQREALQQARGMRPTEPMATAMDALFPAELTPTCRAPLIDTTTELVVGHWTGAASNGILIPAHHSLELVTQVRQEWQANVRHTWGFEKNQDGRLFEPGSDGGWDRHTIGYAPGGLSRVASRPGHPQYLIG